MKLPKLHAIIAYGLYTILVGIGFFILIKPLFSTAPLVYVAYCILCVHSFPFWLNLYAKAMHIASSYREEDVLLAVNRLMASKLHLEDMCHEMLFKLQETLHLSRAACIIFEGDEIADVLTEGFESTPELDEDDIKTLAITPGILYEPQVKADAVHGIMKALGVAVVIHLRSEGKLVGLLLLGPKIRNRVFTRQDMELFHVLAPEAALAVSNAKKFEIIRRTNVTLDEQVRSATTELSEASERLLEMDKLKDEFVSLASHELRTPMTAIRGSLSTILEGYAGDISPTVREFLTAAYNENDRLIRLVNNLLNISRIEAGRFVFNVTKVDMKILATEVVHNFQMAAKEKHLYLKFESENSIPMVLADEDKIKEVLINFIGNAIKFTYEGGITIRAWQRDGMVVVSVSDTGHGIAEEDKDLLFQKFSQIQKGYSRQIGGTGLGLYINRQIVEGLKGKIWLDSQVGHGSTFYFSLPIAA